MPADANLRIVRHMKGNWRWAGLSVRLLLLTVVFVMLAEVLIYAPSAGRFRLTYLQDRLSDGHFATMALEVVPYGTLDAPLEDNLLRHAGIESVEARLGNHSMQMLGGEKVPSPDTTVDLRQASFFSLIWDAFVTLTHSEGRILRVIGQSPMNPAVTIEVIMDERPMRAALIDYSYRILVLSLVISAITASLVYLSLQLMIVYPIRQLTSSMLRFRDRPEDETVDIDVSPRRDEIGIAKRVLADMQAGVRQALTQRQHLAALGEAVVKINHDLRNILASAQLVSDRVAQSDDPRVRAAAPALLKAIDRAIGLCSQVVLYSQARRPSLKLTDESLRDLLEEAGDNVLALGAAQGQDTVWRWVNEVPEKAQIRCDRLQLLRVFENVARNAFEAGATEIRFTAQPEPDRWNVAVEDNGPGLPEKTKENLFQPFQSSARAGGTGLGLVIARELVVAHGGRLFLDRTGPDGTRFVLELLKAASNNNQRRVSA